VLQSSNFFGPITAFAGTVSVNIIDPNIGCSGTSAPVTMSVTTANNIVLSSSDADNTVCAGDIVTYSTTGGGALDNYAFFVNGALAQTGTTTTFSSANITASDTIHVVVTATGAAGCVIQTAPIITTENTIAPTLISSTGGMTFCSGDIVTFFAGGGTSYEFSVNGAGMY